MLNCRRLALERLEYYLVYLILAYRRLILIFGLLLLVDAIATMFVNRMVGFVVLLPAIFLLLLGNSYNAIVFTARMGAWMKHFGDTMTEPQVRKIRKRSAIEVSQ